MTTAFLFQFSHDFQVTDHGTQLKDQLFALGDLHCFISTRFSVFSQYYFY